MFMLVLKNNAVNKIKDKKKPSSALITLANTRIVIQKKKKLFPHSHILAHQCHQQNSCIFVAVLGFLNIFFCLKQKSLNKCAEK